MEIRFDGGDIRGAQRFGDVGITADGHAHVIKRTFGQWAIHCLKFYNPFGGYRNRIKQQRSQIYQQLIQNNSADSSVTQIHAGSRKTLLRELSALLPDQVEAAQHQTEQPTEHQTEQPTEHQTEQLTDRTPPVNLGQERRISAQTSVEKWGNPQTAAASMDDEKFHRSGIKKLSGDTKEQYKTALCHEMRARIENKIANKRPDWGNAAEGTENTARKEATVAFLIMDYARDGNYSETQPLVIDGRFEESRFAAFGQLEERAEHLELLVPTNFTVDVACQLVEKLEFKNGELATSHKNNENIGRSAAGINFRTPTSDTGGVKFRLPEGTDSLEVDRFAPTVGRFIGFMGEGET